MNSFILYIKGSVGWYIEVKGLIVAVAGGLVLSNKLYKRHVPTEISYKDMVHHWGVDGYCIMK